MDGMRGCRPLSNEEVELVAQSFYGTFALRDRCLFLLGVYAGYRIGELLSLRVGDVVEYGQVKQRVRVQRRSMKGKQQSRSVILHQKAQEAISAWIEAVGDVSPSTFLFRSREGQNRSISRVQAGKILKEAFAANQLPDLDRLSTHSLRKTYANRAYENSGHDLLRTATALGHRSPQSTVSYLSFKTEEIDDLVMMAS